VIDLAFSSNAFKKNTLAEAIDAIARIGYRGVELMADLHHANPATFDASARAVTRRQLEALGLAISNVNAFTYFCGGDTYHPTWIEDDPTLLETRITHTIGSIEIASEFGAKTVSLQPGGPLIGTTLSREDASERFADGLNRVLPTARQHNIILAVEPEPGLFIQTAQEFLDFRNQHFKNEPRLQMNCDIGHLFCVGDDPAEVIRNHAQHIAHVHLEDIGKNRVHQHLTPGKGVIDFEKVFDALESIHYRGRVTVELYPYETTAAGVAKMAWEHLKPMIA
jgi:sugar phosphate isomerase/epimerase